MKILKEELWQHPGDPGLILVTGNGQIAYDRRLVMGRGAALEATKRIPNIEYEAARLIQGYPTKGPAHVYRLVIVRPPNPPKVGFGIFQVKYSWKDEADLDLIRESTQALKKYAEKNPQTNIRMNFPGIGHGRRKDARDEIEQILSILPDNVTVCYR